MNKAPKSSSFGLAGGVLSVLGLCVGIVSLGKKQGTAVKSLPAPFAAPRQEAGQPVFDANDRTGAQVAELFVEQDLEPQLCSEESAIGECLELGPERSAAQDTIAESGQKRRFNIGDRAGARDLNRRSPTHAEIAVFVGRRGSQTLMPGRIAA
ncbi:MAG: hypothetical protein ACJ74Y_04680 [Bryobacteraceae bacterium]